ncbi:MAG TPA: Ig-like domain-containing protein, partial [Gammaproteobacteria bacterium]|nr:Ig-like domain-containing protein [Gammaproteobacteria bacterium]
MRKLRIVLVMAGALALAACHGGSDNTLTGGSTAGSGTTGGTSSADSGGNTANASSLTATSSSPTLPSDGSSNVTITAYVRDAQNKLIAGVPVQFSASSGGISGSPAITDDSGAANGTLITAGDDALRTITVTATAGSMTTTVDVQVVATSTSTNVQMGNGSGAGFQAGDIGISSTDVSAGGSTSLTVSLVQPGGTLYTGSATVS